MLACRNEGKALGSSLQDVFRALRRHQLEVLDEARGQGVILLEILVAAGPGAGRIVGEVAFREAKKKLVSCSRRFTLLMGIVRAVSQAARQD
jgi:hypothetical protein